MSQYNNEVWYVHAGGACDKSGEVGIITNTMNKKWFRRSGGLSIALIPISIEGWIWILLIFGLIFYFFNLDSQDYLLMFGGLIVTVLVGLAVAIIKSE